MVNGLIQKKQLEILLQSLETLNKLNVQLEQYPLDAKTAADILYIATYTYRDIEGKVVYDLGCGAGILAIGAALLGAKKVYGVDIDAKIIEIAKLNASRLGLSNKIRWIIADVENVKDTADTVIQNPPFGVKRKGADLRFLKKAVEIAKVVYSLHKSNPKTFAIIKKTVENLGARIDQVFQLELKIPHIYEFHFKKVHRVKVDLYRIVKT